jgi:hypothetical protein
LSSGFRGVPRRAAAQQFAIGTAVRANSHFPASIYEPNNSTIVSVR